MVGWESKDQDTSGWGLFMRKVDATGPITAEVAVNVAVTSDQRNLSLAAAPSGATLAACWDSLAVDANSTWGITCQLFSASDLAPAGVELSPNVLKAGAQQSPAVAFVTSGDWIVTWASEGVDHSAFAVHSQRYGALGTVNGPRVVVNRTWGESQSRPVVAAVSASATHYLWQSDKQDGDQGGIYLRVMPPP